MEELVGDDEADLVAGHGARLQDARGAAKLDGEDPGDGGQPPPPSPQPRLQAVDTQDEGDRLTRNIGKKPTEGLLDSKALKRRAEPGGSEELLVIVDPGTVVRAPMPSVKESMLASVPQGFYGRPAERRPAQ